MGRAGSAGRPTGPTPITAAVIGNHPTGNKVAKRSSMQVPRGKWPERCPRWTPPLHAARKGEWVRGWGRGRVTATNRSAKAAARMVARCASSYIIQSLLAEGSTPLGNTSVRTGCSYPGPVPASHRAIRRRRGTLRPSRSTPLNEYWGGADLHDGRELCLSGSWCCREGTAPIPHGLCRFSRGRAGELLV